MPGRKESEQERREQLLRAAIEVAAHAGVGGLTVRAIAAEARVSHGLVHFHFRTKDRLVRALLDWVLRETLTLDARASEVGSEAPPLDRLRAILHHEMERLATEPIRMRLFFEFWAMGTRDPSIGERISMELEGYRSSLRELTDEVLRSEPDTFFGVTADGLAAVAVSFINGCAVQAMIDPGHFDIGEYLSAVRAMMGRLVPTER
jgi:TetR/AcrR family transcriptional regulator, transcriptional repressor of bet genes